MTTCLDLDALKKSQWLYIEGYLAASEMAVDTALKAIDTARHAGVKVSVSLSDKSMIDFCRPGLDALLKDKIDFLFSNQEEACSYTGCDDLAEAEEKMKDLAHSYAITLGANGAIIFDGASRYKIDAQKVKAVDTNGAGDIFAGSFLYGITNGYSFEQAGQIASYASGLLVTCFGPRLDKENINKVTNFIKSL
jgi:sugar/nucleoside kinase (ribokinase family)